MEQIEKCCHAHGIPYVVLHKREIENYLPVGILQRVPKRYRNTYKAFLKLSQQQKDYYDMKSGFKLDASSGQPLIPQEQQNLFQNVRSPVLRALCGGFGNDVWRLFITARNDITEDALKHTCCTCPGELDRIMDHIESLL